MNDLAKLRKNQNSYQFQYKLTERYRMGLHNAFEIWQLYGVNRSLLHKWNCRYYRYRILSPKTYFSMRPKKKSDKARIAELEAENKHLRAAYADEKLGKECTRKMGI